jgi:hypothetical protein
MEGPRDANLRIRTEVSDYGLRLVFVVFGREPVPIEVGRDRLDECRESLRDDLESVQQDLGDDLEITSWSRLSKAIGQIHASGTSILTELFGKRLVDVSSICSKACAGWDDERLPPPLIQVEAPLEALVPLEFLPVFDTSRPGSFQDIRGLNVVARRFPGFSAIIRRVFPEITIAVRTELRRNPCLPVKFFRHRGLPGVQSEYESLTHDNRVDVDGPWPNSSLTADGFRALLAQVLLRPSMRFDGARRDPPDQVYHFACHCDTTKRRGDAHLLRLGSHGDEACSVTIKQLNADLGNLYGQRDFHPDEDLPLVFLNACGGSAIGREGVASFPRFFLNNGYIGFVGTEATIPDSFAAGFSRTFFDGFLGGLPLGRALLEAKKSMLYRYRNPLGLFYTLYANPHIKMAQAPPMVPGAGGPPRRDHAKAADEPRPPAAGSPGDEAGDGTLVPVAEPAGSAEVPPWPLTGEGRPTLHALLIGADHYLPNSLQEGSYHDLRGCVRDVRAVEEFLLTRLGLDGHQILTLTASNAGSPVPPEPPNSWPTYWNIVRAFGQVADRASPGDHVLVHYSGHGGRVPTLLPEVKGAGGVDEALVPVDVGESSARYLRDIELAKLLQDMAAKGLQVTMVLDCCHSGGATRGPDSAARGVSFIDRTPRLPGSEVGSMSELRSAWESWAGPGSTRGVTCALTAAPYVLLAACRPSEVAHEYAFDGQRRRGALTYWLLDSLRQFGGATTFRMIHDRVVAKIHETFPSQTAMLVGDPGRIPFRNIRIERASVFQVSAVDLRAGRLTVSAGLSAGLAVGADFAIYPRDQADLGEVGTRKAWARLSGVRDTESDADIVEQYAAGAPAPGDQALLLGAAHQTLVRRVRIVGRDPSALTHDDPVLSSVKAALPGNRWVEPVESSEQSASFVVRLGGDGTQYEICTPDYVPIPLRPPLLVSCKASPRMLVRRLVHLAKYQAALELENNAQGATLQHKLGVELLALPDGFKANAYPWPQPEPFEESVPTVRNGQWVCLRVINRSTRPFNVTVLDLQPSWAIVQAYPPDSDYEELEPARGPLIIPFQVSLPPRSEGGIETLKVLATIKPTSFRPLLLPPLDQPIPSSSPARGSRRGIVMDPLSQLLDAVGAKQPRTRDLSAAAVPGLEWAIAKRQVRIVGKSP